jgi:hypothetical protein
MASLEERLNKIESTIDGSISSSIYMGETTYIIESSIEFNNAILEFDSISNINLNIDDYILYNDLKIKIGSILSDIKDKSSAKINTVYIEYDVDSNTLQIAEKYFSSMDEIQTLYLANNVNSDFELLTGQKILVWDI